MQEDTNFTEYKKGKLILKDNNNPKDNTIDIPIELINSISQLIKNRPDIKANIQEVKNVEKTTWDIIISPELQEGIDNGSLKRDRCKLEIRDSKTGKYVGKAELKEVKDIKKTVIKEHKPSAISNITRNICNISGQIQMAEILQKLDMIDKKIDSIKEEMRKEKISTLKSQKNIIEEALKSIPNNYSMDRINSCINTLTDLSYYFQLTIENVLSRKISYNVFDSFKEGFIFWELLKNNRSEYNNVYLNKIKKFLNEYGYLIELYSQTMALLGTCYQIIHGYESALTYYNKMNHTVSKFSVELYNKLIYLLDLDSTNLNSDISQSYIRKQLSSRSIPIYKNIQDSFIKINNSYKMYYKLTNQFNDSKILLEVDSKNLLGGIYND